jgi:hypothetical protein
MESLITMNFQTSHINHCFWDNRKSNLNLYSFDELSYSEKAHNQISAIQYMPKFGSWIVTIIKNDKLIIVGIYDNMFTACKAFRKVELYKETEYKRVFGEDYNINGRIHGKTTDFHSRYFMNIDGVFYGFPSWFDISERNNLCQRMIDLRPDLFEYHLPNGKNDLYPVEVEKRLTILASYLIEADQLYKCNKYITKYKYSRIKDKEKQIDPINEKDTNYIDEINKNSNKIIK